MLITQTTDSELVGAVRDNLHSSRYLPYVDRIVNEVLAGHTCYLWGGSVREPLAKMFHGTEHDTKDFDILVDDSVGRIDFKKLLMGLNDIYYTRLGSPKWKPVNGLEIPIVPFSNATRLRNGEDLPISLETALSSCEFNTGAIAYGLDDETIHSYGAIEGIRRKEIEINYAKGEEPHVLMARLVMQADKLGFSVGPKAAGFVAENYSSGMDPHIKRYLEYKQLPQFFQFIKARLVQIQSQSR